MFPSVEVPSIYIVQIIIGSYIDNSKKRQFDKVKGTLFLQIIFFAIKMFLVLEFIENDCNLRKTIKNEGIMLKEQKSFLNSFSVHQQKLRDRTLSPQPRQTCPGTACCTPITSIHKSKENLAHQINYQPIRQQINWLKYNILVSIYDNWLRLQPFISYWISKTFRQNDNQDPQIKCFLKKAIPAEKQAPKAEKEQVQKMLDEMRNRREQLLKNMLPSSQDLQILTKATQLAKQLLSTLPLQNQKWSKARIQNHNRIIEDMIKNFSQQQFEMNSEAIMHSIKERIYFIDQIQRKFISCSKQEKNKLSQKIQLLKQPFQKAFNMSKKSKAQPQQLFEKLWHEIEEQRTKILQNNEKLRTSFKQKKRNQNHRMAIIQKPETGGLIIKYQLRHDDYYNQPYNKAKSRHRKGKQKGKHAIDSINQSINEDNQSATKDSVDNNEITPSSNSQIEINVDFDKQEINNKCVEDFMKRQKLKHTYRDQSSNFFKKNPSKFENGAHYRPSISYIDNVKSFKDGDFASQKSRMSTSYERTSVLGRRGSRNRPSAEQITQKQDHLSRFKSHKKIITMKNIGGTKYTRLNKDENKNNDMEQPSIARISGYFNKNQKKQYRRERVDLRKGHCFRKGAHRRQLQNNDQTTNQTPIDFLHLNRQQFLNYFNKILLSGVLDSQKYDQLRQRVQLLIKSNEPSALFENHVYVQKLIDKSIKNDYSCLLGEGRQTTLFNLYEVICKDENIRAKIRDQMKIMLDDVIVQQCCSSESINNEQYMFHSTQLRKVNQQLKRILNFQIENDTITFANKLVRESNKLKQRSF